MIKELALSVMILLMAMPSLGHEPSLKNKLVIAISSDFQPFTFLNAEGKPAGMFVDMWRLWAQKTGKQVEFVASDWKTSLEKLKTRKADIHSGLSYSPERFEWMSGSQPFYEVGVSLFYPLNQGGIGTLKELSGQTIAALKGSLLELFLKKNYPDIRILSCDTREELVRVSREGKAKAFVAISQVGTSAIDRLGLSGEFGTYDKILYREKVRAGVLRKNTELLALVNKGFGAISANELADIETRWVPDPAKRYFKASNVRLTPAEEAWLSIHKTIRVGMAPIFPPLKFSEKSAIKGIEPDYLNLVSEYTGIQFEYVVCDLSVMDAKVKSGEIDMFLSFYIPERLSYMTFTEPFMEFKQVIITRNDAPFISGIGALKGKKIATVKGVKLYDKVLSPFREIEVVQVDTMEEMFEAVSECKADALVSKTFFAGYVMQNYPNLKIAGIADLPPEPYYYAVRKDFPELVSILNKAISSIPRDKHDTILQKWFSVQIEYRPNWFEIVKWAIVIGGLLVLILVLSLFWNRRLTKEIEKRKQAESALKESKEALHAFFDAVHDSMVLIDPQGTILLSNIVGARRLGKDVEEFVGTGLYDHFSPDIARFRREQYDKVVATGEPVYFEDKRAGRIFEQRCFPVLDEEGKVTAVAIFAGEITERKEAEERLASEHRQLQAVLENAPFGIMLIAKNGLITYLNPKFTELLGYTLDDIPNGKTWVEKAYPDPEYRHQAIASWTEDLKGAQVREKGTRTFTVTCKNGTQKVIYFISVQLQSGEHLVSLEDHTELYKYQEDLAYLAVHDTLTGLFNRHFLEEMLNRAVARARRGTLSSLLYIDLDHFKEVNDTAGHSAGDAVLANLARLFKEVLRTEDIVFRVGGDEFGILLEGINGTEAPAVAGRLCSLVAGRPVETNKGVFILSLSIGLVEINGLLTMDELLSRADTAMYEAKGQGGNSVVIARNDI